MDGALRCWQTGMASALLFTVINLLVWSLIANRTPTEPSQVRLDGHSVAAANPVLTSEQQYEIHSLAQSYVMTQAVIRVRQPRLSGAVTWTDSSGSVLGGAIEAIFSKPQSISENWKAVVFNCRARNQRQYETVPYGAMAMRARYVMMFVDLNRKQIVGVEPDVNAKLTQIRMPEDHGKNFNAHYSR